MCRRNLSARGRRSRRWSSPAWEEISGRFRIVNWQASANDQDKIPPPGPIKGLVNGSVKGLVNSLHNLHVSTCSTRLKTLSVFSG